MRGINLAIAVVVLGWGASAGAEEEHEGHLEVEFGFVGGQRSYDQVAFSYQEGEASPGLAAPFLGEPFDGVGVAGVSTEMRLVVRGVRFGIGFAWPHARIDPPVPVMIGAETVTPAQVRALDVRETRFSLGYEYPLDRVTPFFDVVGTRDRVDADVVLGDLQSTYRATNFGFSVQAGVRVAITRYYFAHASAELGLDGNVRGGGVVGVGLRAP